MTAADGATWTGWITTASTSTAVWVAWSSATTAIAELTQDELAANAAQQAERQARAARDKAEREEADKKAEILLIEHLNNEQKQSYAANKNFPVSAPSGKRYIIERSGAQNVYEVDETGKRKTRLCAVTPHGVPVGDMLLAQKLMLEHDEAAFLRIANVIQRYP